MSGDSICEWLAEAFGAPCEYTFNGQDISDYTLEHYAEWCDEHCGSIAESKCWKRYFEEIEISWNEDDRKAVQNERDHH